VTVCTEGREVQVITVERLGHVCSEGREGQICTERI